MSEKHAKHSPSSLDNLDKCVRFKHVEMEDASSEGTDLHAAYTANRTKALHDDEQKESVQGCIDYTASLLATESGPGEWFDMQEVRVVLRDLTWGHADRVLLHKTKPIAHVLDAKFTRVEGVHDFQIRTYGAAFCEMMAEAASRKQQLVLQSPETDSTWKIGVSTPLEHVTTHVMVPRLRKIDTAAHVPIELLASVRQEITELYERCNDPFEQPTPNEDTCQRCANAHRCPALSSTAISLSKGLGLPMPQDFDMSSTASPKDRGRAQVLAQAFENWAKGVKSFNTEFVDAGGEIPGFKMISRSTGARIDKEDTATAAILLRDMGVTTEDILNASRLSINDLTAIVAGGDPNRTKVRTKEEIIENLTGIIKAGAAKYLTRTRRRTDLEQLEEVNK